MIISRTPFRISFFGGGTDYPPWIAEHGGAVLSTSFDKYSYISCRNLPPFFDHSYRITYSEVEHVVSAGEIKHPAIRAVVGELFPGEGLEIQCNADLPARSGLGSSSAFVVGLLNALYGLRGQRVPQSWLAREAMRFEQEVLGETVGCQDQVATAMGGLNVIRFIKNGEFLVDPLVITAERRSELEKHLLLFFTGFSRISSLVAKAKVDNLFARSAQLHRMTEMVYEAADLLAGSGDIRQFGELLHQSWLNKRQLSEVVSNQKIDAIYETARRHGAIGGKLLGAGSGGFMVLFVEPGKQAAVLRALADLVHVPFAFENSGSRIVYYA